MPSDNTAGEGDIACPRTRPSHASAAQRAPFRPLPATVPPARFDQSPVRDPVHGPTHVA